MNSYQSTSLTRALFISLMLISVMQTALFAQAKHPAQEDPWNTSQLLAPSELAKTIETEPKEKQPLVLSIGPAAMIKGSIDLGAASDKDGLNKLKTTLAAQPKDREIVIYCGCCPFAHCPNVRPAFSLLKEMHFTNARLLNLEHNIRTDWIDKGYPSEN